VGELASVGERETSFPLRHGRGDQVRDGGAGPVHASSRRKRYRARDIYVPDLRIDTIKVETRDFH
jgi:error-prone DNA polymerase